VNVLAVDPGLNRSGVATFRDGVLIRAGAPSFSGIDKAPLPARIAAMGLRIALSAPRGIYTLAMEWPQVYAVGKSKGDPNDLLPLAGICADVAARLNAPVVVMYSPREWAGNTKKSETVKGAKTSMRAKRIESRLTGPELEVWAGVKYHDTVDAIGIGLKALGRFERRRAFQV